MSYPAERMVRHRSVHTTESGLKSDNRTLTASVLTHTSSEDEWIARETAAVKKYPKLEDTYRFSSDVNVFPSTVSKIVRNLRFGVSLRRHELQYFLI